MWQQLARYIGRETSRNHYHSIWCSLYKSPLRPLTSPPPTPRPAPGIVNQESVDSVYQALGRSCILLREVAQAIPSTYIVGSWLPHSSAETSKWGAKRAASYSASLEAWDKETQKHTHWQQWKGNMDALSLTDSYKRVIRVQGVSQAQETSHYGSQ